LGIAEGKINDTRLYRCLDRLLPQKSKLEQQLRQRYGELFQAEFDVLLYDLTSTYVEGAAAQNPLMQRGYSRDHRPDCKQVVIALIVNEEGFPLSYEVFDGDRAEVTTLEAVPRTVERKYGRARRIWVFDRGVVSEENLATLRKRQGSYLVGTPRSKLNQFEGELLEGGWEQIRPEVEGKRVRVPSREEAYILLRTNLQAESAAELWTKYIQLTEAETAFRALKSELSIRPLFHRLERRVKAHILVAFLGYALWVTLKHLLRGKNIEMSPAKALALLSTLQSADIVLPTTEAREIRLRRITNPSAEQQNLLARLNLTLPERIGLPLECSADSAVA